MSDIAVPQWIRSLIPYPPGKPIAELERELGIRDSIKLASNENPLGPSPKAIAAIQAALGELHRYPEGSCPYLRDAVARHLDVPADTLLFGNGSNELIELIARTFLQRGDEALMADQAFVVYRLIVQAIGAQPRIVPLCDYTHDLESIAAAITPATRVIFLANPNNPTGTIFFRQAWQRFLERVPPQVVVVLDEAYAEYVEDSEYPDGIAAVRQGRPVVALRTFSKLYGLAGLRVGYGIGRPDLIDLMNRVRQPFNVNSLAQIAATAALDDHQHVEGTRAVNRAGLAYLRAELARLDCEVVPSWANFLLVRVVAGAELYQSLLREGVIVRPMDGYGFPDHVRVTIGTEAENRRLVAALERCLQARSAGGATL